MKPYNNGRGKGDYRVVAKGDSDDNRQKNKLGT